jgi:hypothetical protein
MNNSMNTPASKLKKGGLVKAGSFYGEVDDISDVYVTIRNTRDELKTFEVEDCQAISPNEYLCYLFTPSK